MLQLVLRAMKQYVKKITLTVQALKCLLGVIMLFHKNSSPKASAFVRVTRKMEEIIKHVVMIRTDEEIMEAFVGMSTRFAWYHKCIMSRG